MTSNPAKRFAPVVYLYPRESYRPMAARWFLSRAALLFAEDDGCDDRKIAVGRRLKRQRNAIVDWLYVEGIGRGPNYYRSAYADQACDGYRGDFATNQLTRPYDDAPQRPAELHTGEGFYLDLMDWARGGTRAAEVNGQAVIADVPVWFEQEERQVDGERGLLITYWMLYGMDAVSGGRRRSIRALTHEGDWERVQIMLQGSGRDWLPMSVRFSDLDGGWREVPWHRLDLEGTHPVAFAARGSHVVYPSPGGTHSYSVRSSGGSAWIVVDAIPRACVRCLRWRTWEVLAPASKQAWYGFGGAWGDVEGGQPLDVGPPGPRATVAGDLDTH